MLLFYREVKARAHATNACHEQVSGLLPELASALPGGGSVVHARCLESGNLHLDQHASVQVLAIFDGDGVYVDLVREYGRLLRLDALDAMQVPFHGCS
jgi:hypothetical protein